jgi:hypothetical protein
MDEIPKVIPELLQWFLNRGLCFFRYPVYYHGSTNL